jgi:hypothetical protein
LDDLDEEDIPFANDWLHKETGGEDDVLEGDNGDVTY